MDAALVTRSAFRRKLSLLQRFVGLLIGTGKKQTNKQTILETILYRDTFPLQFPSPFSVSHWKHTGLRKLVGEILFKERSFVPPVLYSLLISYSCLLQFYAVIFMLGGSSHKL